MALKLSAQESEFIDQLGQVAESGGMTRITGWIWGLLVICGEALAPAEIARILQISRASVSSSIRILEAQDLLVITTRPGDRQRYFAMREQPYRSMVQQHAKRAAAHIDVVQRALKQIDRPEARQRLRDLDRFYKVMQSGYASMLAELGDP